jgi:hypothetical protein
METDKPTLLTNQGREPAAKGPMRSLVGGGMHYIRSGDGHEELYDLGSDPEERMDVAGMAEAREVLQHFRDGLRWMLRTRRPGGGQPISHFSPPRMRQSRDDLGVELRSEGPTTALGP